MNSTGCCFVYFAVANFVPMILQGTHASDNEDIDRAIALSLSEEGQRKGKAIG